ncbi:ATP-binding cassette sub-family G member 8-like [Babylonia areolata]|uniref:ATP-binding cassette sub-family G member 8-like n=1 Tax=Babylonia areolata TaxID=304850 RepID=UPI003FD5D9F3
MNVGRRESQEVLHDPITGGICNISVDVENRPITKEAHEAVDVHVRGLTYRVPRQRVTWWQEWLTGHPLLPTSCTQQTRLVLSDVTFTVRSGQMLAILGTSGSGKTSMLDVIACRNKCGEVKGDVLLNGVPRTAAMISRCAAYVRQDDRLMASLTVRETLMFVAQLKLPKSFTEEAIRVRVNNVIAELGLLEAADTRIGSAEIRGISGGERRRVSIGIQMLIDPSLLFLDEPTSGLDSFTASHLVSTLSHLARNRRTILMSIHQPRSNIFELFDLVMLLSRGRVVYFGQARDMVDYFTRLEFPCPQLTNPCDYYVDLTTVDPTSEETEESTAEVVSQLQQAYKADADAANGEEDDIMSGDNGNVGEGRRGGRGSSVLDGGPTRDIYPGVYRQFSILFRRWMRSTLEDWSLMGVRSIQAVAMSIMLGVVYWNLHHTEDELRDHFGILYMVSIMYPYLIIMDIIETCHKERKLLYFETQDHLYTTEAYYLAKVASDLPFHTFFVLLYVLPVYYMSGMPVDTSVFFQVFAIVFLSVLCSRGLAMMSAAVMPSFQTSCFFAQCLFSFFIMSAGFFINLDNILSALQWVSVISYLRWGFEGLCLAEIKPLNFTCSGSGSGGGGGGGGGGRGQCFQSGEDALRLYAFGDGEMWQSLTALGSNILVFFVLMYAALKLIPQQPEEHS